MHFGCNPWNLIPWQIVGSDGSGTATWTFWHFCPKFLSLYYFCKNEQKTWKRTVFGQFFKVHSTVHQTNKFKFLELFCVFWHPRHPQQRKNSGDSTVFTFIFEIFQFHLAIFFIIFNIKPDFSIIGLSIIKEVFPPFS